MNHWQRWAERALTIPGADADVRAALERTLKTGHEPYYTLKGAVCRLEERAAQASPGGGGDHDEA